MANLNFQQPPRSIANSFPSSRNNQFIQQNPSNNSTTINNININNINSSSSSSNTSGKPFTTDTDLDPAD